MITFEDVEKELLRKYKMIETLSVENLENFVNKTIKGEIEPYYISEDVPDK